MFEKILVPLDGSNLAEQSLPYVTELASAFASEVTLIGVCEPEETDQGEVCRLTISNKADEMEHKLSPSGSKVRTVVLEGRPAPQIIDYAEKSNTGLIILTSHGSSGLAPWSLGGTVQKILQLKSKIPLLLIKPQEVPVECNGLFSQIILPIDGSKASEATIPYVVELVRKFETDVTLLRVIEEGHHVRTLGGLQYIPYYDQDINKARAKAAEYLIEVSTAFARTKARLKREVRQGDAAREILKMIEEKGQCLVAMASHGHSGIDAWTFGSVTHKIVQASSRPILIVKT